MNMRTRTVLWVVAVVIGQSSWALAQEGNDYVQPIGNPNYPAPYTPPEAEGDGYQQDGYAPEGADDQVAEDNQAAETYDDGYDPQAYTQFEGALAPYGAWNEDPNYGRVWTPSAAVVGGDFVPYGGGGRWVQSEYGWTWVSAWDWGWAPFHYGRWIACASGWGWVPGRVWGPGWVAWRYGGGYAGWAPLPPRGVRVGAPSAPRSPWRFVVGTQIGAPRPAFLPAHVIPSVFGRTAVVTNTRTMAAGALQVRVNAGPPVSTFGGAMPLRTIAPQALPRLNIPPRVGTAVASRPWVRAGISASSGGWGVPVRAVPINNSGFTPRAAPRPLAPGPARPAPLPYRPAPTHSYYAPQEQPGPRSTAISAGPRYGASSYMPRYSAFATPRQSAPVYAAPAPHYSAPAPAPHYSAPAPAPHYSAPAPSYSAPSHATGGGHHR